ncbi:MAG: glycosyltransferase family 2 protein [Rhodospirillales bacterium]|nr:glycosyltransferase family 2 protein [Rhodospirillales bacterium]
MKLGIGITTYNRRDVLRETVERVRSFTDPERTSLVVADDGSTDGTVEMLRQTGTPFVTGANMGVAWNKNRALYLLNFRLRCDVTILFEDDARPRQAGWERPWLEAAERFGHANCAGEWLAPYFLGGAGTPEDPIRSSCVTAQCAVFSAAAIERSGYFDPRFRGYGHEHVEHSARLVRHGFGGVLEQGNAVWSLIRSPIEFVPTQSFGTAETADRNLDLARRLMTDQSYRAPWQDDAEMRQFLGEIDAAEAPAASGFALRSPDLAQAEERASFLARLLNGMPQE